ncbi:Low molecular weight phosphotyrosine protein phosphatase [Rhodosporidiobolus nylandii]
MPSVLFVCLGNICRSPLAEAVFADICQKRGYTEIEIDSAGTAGYHVGEEPDDRKHKVPINSRCRQLQKSDFTKFDYIIGMDKSNMSNIARAAPKNSTAKIAMFGEFGDNKTVDDPYYGGDDGFERVYQQCLKYSEGLLEDMGYGGAEGKAKV